MLVQYGLPILPNVRDLDVVNVRTPLAPEQSEELKRWLKLRLSERNTKKYYDFFAF